MDSKIKLQRLEMQELFTEENINRKKVETALSRLGTLKTQSEISFVYHLLDLREVLTPEQITKLETIKQERRRQYWHDRAPRSREDRGRF
jgi:Spy/CpxP family protein refolding chaperone